jgi:membrane associated rhomboid family serine protease
MIKPICPRCHAGLGRRITRGVFQYVCPTCQGFSVQFAELGRILDAGDVKELWESSKTAPLRPNKSCTHCRKPMHSVVHGAGAMAVELDVCSNCVLVWLDTNEWQSLKGTTEEHEASKETAKEEYARPVDLENEAHTEKFRVERARVDSVWKALVTIVGLPVEEEPDHFNAKPWITWLVIALCFAVSLWSFANAAWAREHLAFATGRPLGTELLTSITSFFVHGSVWHLAGNMYFLWIFGDSVEDHIGKIPYVFLLLAATLLGDLAYALFDPHAAKIPEVGASGGIYGLIAYYLIRFPQRRFVVFVLIMWLAVPSWVLGVLFFGAEAVGALQQLTVGTATSHLAHIGGALVGCAFAYYYSPFRKALAADLRAAS